MDQMLYIMRYCQARGQEPDAPLTEAGQKHGIALADRFKDIHFERIVSSPYVRAYQSIVPLARHLGLSIETDPRLMERVLSSTPLDNWQKRLAETFVDLRSVF